MGRHLSERDLVELWPDGGSDAHVTACARCRARYDAIVSVLDAAQEAADEADTAITPEGLAAQQAHILRRLENAERPARVLPFPATLRPARASRPDARRWIAAAAAAGLLTGIVAGRALDLGRLNWRAPGVSASRAESASRRAPVLTATATAATNDERLLGEIESAIVESRVDELRAIDALTPRVREVRLTR